MTAARSPRPQGRAAYFGGQHDSQQSGRTKRRNRLGRKSSFLVVLPGRRCENAIGDFPGIRNCGLVIHDDPRHLGVAYQSSKISHPLPLRPMLRHAHHRINTTGFGHGKLLPYQQRVRAVVITFFKAILLHHLKIFFCDVAETLAALARCCGEACPLSERTLPMTGNRVTRLVW